MKNSHVIVHVKKGEYYEFGGVSKIELGLGMVQIHQQSLGKCHFFPINTITYIDETARE